MRRLFEEAGVLTDALLTRRMAAGVAAALLVVSLTIAGVVLEELDWVTPLLALAIVLVGMMFGVRGGFVAAFVASAGFFAWGVAEDGFDVYDVAHHRHLVFFALGLLTGYYAHGVLGDYHLGRAMSRARFRRAIRRGQVVLHYQPVAEANTGRILELEGLARWEDPERGTLMPAEFVPLAEGDRPTIWEFTLHTLRLAIEECGRWERDGHEVGVSVNLSSAAVDHPGLADEIATMLSASRLSPHRLTLEVTESAVMGHPARVARALARIRSIDTAWIAIDDFGTGYSSLARLEQLPIDTLKIDQLFMRRSEEERRRSLLRSIIELAHGLNLTACAEGVEDQTTLQALVRLGCDTVQGYAISRPLPPDRVEQWLTENQARS